MTEKAPMTQTKPCKKCGSTEFYANRNCKPCTINRVEKWSRENKERQLASINKWREENKDKVRATSRKHNKKYSQKYEAVSAQWAIENQDKRIQAGREWRKNNPASARAIKQRRRARLIGVGGSFNSEDIKKLMSLQKYRCVVCEAGIAEKYHIDHIMPIALGGSNDAWNLQLLCPKCNQQKSARHPVEFMQSRGFLL
jgi:5-methylcytosine-specific restriction endonuclease McrA